MKNIPTILLIAGALIAGLIVFSFPAKHTYNYASSLLWVKTPAQIEEVKWIAGNVMVGGGANRTRRPRMGYETTGVFRYDFEGKTYRSQNLVLIQGKSTHKKKQRRVYDTLKFHHRKAKPITAFVNSKKPEQAVLFRGYDWFMALAMFFFSGVFFLVAFAGISVLRDND